MPYKRQTFNSLIPENCPGFRIPMSNRTMREFEAHLRLGGSSPVIHLYLQQKSAKIRQGFDDVSALSPT